MYVHRRGPLFDWLKSQRDMSDCGNVGRRWSRCAAADCWGRIFWPFTPITSNRPTSRRWPNRGPMSCIAREVTPIFSIRRFRTGNWPLPGSTSAWAPTAWPASIRPRRGESGTEHVRGNAHVRGGVTPMLRRNKSCAWRQKTARGRWDCKDRVGGIFRGGMADLAAIPLPARTGDAWAAVIHHRGDALATMIDGRWAAGPSKTENSSDKPARTA